MSVRKDIGESRKHVTAKEQSVREKQEAKVFALGRPLRPQYLHNNRPLCAQYKKYEDWLYKKNLLAYSDGAALLELSEAEIAGQKDRKAKALAHWKNRAPFPAEVIAGSGIENFIAKVREERESFTERMRPVETLCLSLDSTEFEWPEGNAATVARRYAVDSVGSPDCGELVKQACARFIEDLETGHDRGLFFDPVAVQHIVEFSENFCGLKLMDWQVFFYANVYGWKRPTGVRRFTEALCSVAKKNGKTAMGAISALWALICDQEKYADVFCSATKKEQSRLVWRDAKRMVSDNPELRSHVKRWSGALTVSETDSSLTALSSDIKSMDGTRGSAFICDELHMWEDREQFDKLVKGGVSRTQPLCICITTAGDHKGSFCWNKFDLGEKILRGIYKSDETFVLIFQMDSGDDYRDTAVWKKSNPSLGVTLKVEHLKATLAEIEQDPSGLNAFLRYHMNQWIDRTLNRQGSINTKRWDESGKQGLELIGETDPVKAAQKFLALNEDVPAYIGVDVGLREDLTAVVMLWPKARFTEGGDLMEKRVVTCQCFMPEIGLLDKERRWQVPLSVYVRSDFLELIPGDLVDLRTIKEYIIALCTRFRIQDCGADPWSFAQQAGELSESGIKITLVPQVPSQLTAPIQALLGDISRGDLIHFCSPLLTWQIGNAVFVESERTSGMKPEKLSPAEKIDGVSALVNAYHRLQGNPVSNFRSMFLYDDPANPGALIERDPLTQKEIK